MATLMVTDRDFSQRVLDSAGPSLVAFTSRSCEASQQLLPVLDEVSSRFDGRGNVFVVDLGEDLARARANKLVARYGVTRLPAVIAFSDGRPKDLIGGRTTVDDLVDMLDRQVRPVREVIGVNNFKDEVLESNVPVLVHFHAADCEASAALFPVIDTLAEKFAGRAKVVRVEANLFNAAVMEQYGAIRTPVVAAFDNGVMKDSIMGTPVELSRLAQADGTRGAVNHVSEMLEVFL